MQRYIGILGLLFFLGIALLLSKHRKKINWKTVVWGIALQLLFALIILSKSIWSFVGMGIFILLIVLYAFETYFVHQMELKRWVYYPVAAVTSAVIITAFYFLNQITHIAGKLIILSIILSGLVLITVGIVKKRQLITRIGFISLILMGIAMVWQRQVYGADILQMFADKVNGLLNLTSLGTDFLFGKLASPEQVSQFGFQFAIVILSTIIFFSAFMAILYHLGIVQFVINAIARFMRWSMGTSGSETLTVSANIFVGQTEAPFLVKPFIKGMTKSEIHAIMVGGFATIAGGVMAGYIQMGVHPGHLIAASVMSAPAALVIAKLLYPETRHSETAGDAKIPNMKISKNLLEAAANGVGDGLKLALNVGAMLIAFLALIGLVDVILLWLDGIIDGRWLKGALIEGTKEYKGIFPGSLGTLFGVVFRPVAWIMGVPWSESAQVGHLLGLKVTANEFIAYGKLVQHIQAGEMSQRALIISTYALCGFANFASIGIQIGGIGALVPERKRDLARLALRAMLGGAMASWLTATIAGLILI